MYSPGAAHYRQVHVQTMSRGQLLLALYETAITYSHRAAASIRRGDIIAKGREIQRVSDIVAEFASTLDRSVAPELCDNLEMIYFYMQERLSLSNARMDPEPVEEVGRLLATLKEAWDQAVAEVEGGPSQQTRQAAIGR